jgi:endonuclease/exonuclease/phosphatase family metal-dependent hydrolase
MKHFIISIGLWLAISLSLWAQYDNKAQLTTPPHSPNDTSIELNVLSWNIYMLPARTFMNTAQKKRAQLIADTLSKCQYDIIVFSEAFHPKARHILARELKPIYPYQSEVGNQKFGLKTNSGIWVLSRFPLKMLGEIQFESCAGADCWARKGAMLLSIEKNGKTFQILGTHLQSDEDAQRDNIRCQQYQAIYQQLLLPQQQQGIPQIIAGDMNTIATYSQMLQMLNAQDTQQGEINYTWTTPDYGKHQFLFDYILTRPNGTTILEQHSQRTQFRHEWKLRKKNYLDLSDHYGLALQIRFGFDK